jgi:hypothetical protein
MSTVDRGHEPVELYGIIEIATTLGVDRRKVAVWHGRGKLPPADYRASGRPFWKPETITPWIATQAQQSTALEPVAVTADKPPVAGRVDRADQPPRPTPASSSSTPPPSSRSTRRTPATKPATAPARSPSRARGRRAPAVDQHHDGEGGSDPYELTRSSHGWTLTYLGKPIGTVRPAWSATGRSKR